ncbi:DUF1838 domain-containing protein [Novosphingobium sp. FSY-8]|uniref:DUF1838 domain-containing protein n=1 Tax=Novosphingobium ovatum TaxID=1908523 RepID=A0ABW9XBP6_9SPHN|nr:DUF1838 family protein [Novosphingobium ovatum]NBC35963.1 DUF1838 domain-containing protein [Novosphingobium ovatum]
MTGAINRRGAIRAGLGAGVGVAALGMAPRALAATPDLTDPAVRHQVIRRIRYRTDDGLVFWWIRGEYFAAVNSVLTPLYGMCFGSIQQVTGRPDGGFDIRQIEMGFRMMPGGRERMTQFTNPFTGAQVPVPFAPVGPQVIHYSADGVPTVASEFAGSRLEFSPYPDPPYVSGDKVMLPYRAQSRVVTPNAADRVVNDVALFYAQADVALDPRVTSAPAMLHLSDVSSWSRWMQMGERPGMVVMRGIGGKATSLADMPQDWRAMVDAYDPALLRDPVATLARAPYRYGG